jgi:hypothetical protein
MTITIEIKPEVEAELASQAAARGMDVRPMPLPCSNRPLSRWQWNRETRLPL